MKKLKNWWENEGLKLGLLLTILFLFGAKYEPLISLVIIPIAIISFIIFNNYPKIKKKIIKTNLIDILLILTLVGLVFYTRICRYGGLC